MCGRKHRERRGNAVHVLHMLTPQNLPGKRPASEATDETPDEAQGPVPHKLVSESTTAKALYQVWSGQPITLVDSPPGAGKSRLVTTVVAHLTTRSDLRIVVATPTRNQAIDLCHRFMEQMRPEQIRFDVKKVPNYQLPKGLRAAVPAPGTNQVEIRTVANCAFTHPLCDILIIDEAYQTTKADLAKAGSNAKRLLLVGDPGQIGPVVTVDTSAWAHMANGPHLRGPDVLARREDSLTLTMPSSWRLGAETVEAISPLYDFEFDSARPDRDTAGLNELEALEAPETDCPYAPDLMSVAAGRAVELADKFGTENVAVVVSHNAQVSTISGMLQAAGIEGVTVGTADRLQGGEWDAVVAVDPLCGFDGESLGPHALSPGRLCVMASRHRAHLSWVFDKRWTALLAVDGPADLHKKDRKKAVAVRRALTKNVVTSTAAESDAA